MSNFFTRLFGLDEAETFFSYDLTPPAPPPAEQDGVGGIAERLKANGLRLMHFPPRPEFFNPKIKSRGVTVVYRPRRSKNHTIELATAICSEGDSFNRRIGAELALDRFVSGERTQLPPVGRGTDDSNTLRTYFG